MMFLSGVSGLGAFDADYVREQMALRTQQQKAQVQAAVVRATAEYDPETGEGGMTLHRDSRWVTGRSQAEAEMTAKMIAYGVVRREKEAARKKTMLLTGGAVAAILAIVALKG